MADLVRAIGDVVGAAREPEVNRPPGVVYAKCFLKYSLAGVWTFGAGYIIGKYIADPQKMINIFQNVALPAGVILVGMSTGCVKLSLQADSQSSLKELWKRYNNGSLQKDLCQALLTPDLLQFADSKETVELEVQIDEKVYQDASLDLMVHEVLHQNLQSENTRLSLRRSLSDSSLVLNQAISKSTSELFTYMRAKTEAKQERKEATEVMVISCVQERTNPSGLVLVHGGHQSFLPPSLLKVAVETESKVITDHLLCCFRL